MIRFVSLFLIAMTASAQHISGFRGGSMAGFRSRPGRFGPAVVVRTPAGRSSPFFGRGFNRRFGNFAGSYFPYLGAYPFIGDYVFAYSPPIEYPAFNSTEIVPPSPPPPPLKPAHSVIHEYKWNESVAALDDRVTTFTIALKDGSKCYAVAAWVQDCNLNYLDSEGRQQVLSPDGIDRDATQNLNREKNIKLQLPPAPKTPLVNFR
jgi:hypothetical protein